ncbi:MAG: ATP-dependent DNA ligase [Burkholderiaceae bacterium]|nr:ATP-dependent DNA ligase [Microbacteriaceae bacterium]
MTVDGRRIRLTHLDKVLYPETGTTKAQVLDYYARVADVLVAHAANRPATRKRWVHGVGTAGEPGMAFFQKNLDESTPDWVARRTVKHRDHSNDYPLLNDRATLTWLAQTSALELHVPQWQFGRTGTQKNPDRVVLDLDPGDGVGLAECAQVARWAREILTGMGLEPLPVTSGSKGIHLYAALDGSLDSEQVSAVAHELARALEADHRDLVLSDMKRALRAGKVLVDWSQNSANKTTVTPYSLRGRARPMVAAPRTWDELDAPDLAHLDYEQVLDRLAADPDPLAALLAGHLASLEPTPGRLASFESTPEAEDRLATYRNRRDGSKTPEPVPVGVAPAATGTSFVIQEHHARALHWDFRLEHDGVLVSWALPKGVPTDRRKNHLAVQTEDHPLEYGTFAGTIPQGEYGAGEVTIWDSGEFELEKWRDGKEVIVVLHSAERGVRRFALIHTRDTSWLIHLMEDAGVDAAPERPSPAGPVRPMLATAGTAASIDDASEWAFEMKWDGIRAIATITDDTVTLTSRNGTPLSASYPDLAGIPEAVDGAVDGAVVLDGEIIVPGRNGAPDFGRLQQRMGITDARQAGAAARTHPATYVVFDVLQWNGEAVTGRAWAQRRELLDAAVHETGATRLSPVFDGDLDAAIATSVQLGLEGVMAKRLDSVYRPGRRSPSWVKITHHRTQEVVIGGWRPGRGNREGRIGSLLVGVMDGGALRYSGRVGTGFRDADLDLIARRLHPLARATTPFDDVPEADAGDAHWVTPKLVGEVEFAEWTSAGRLRHPTWRGLRPDKQPDDAVQVP